MKPLNSNVLIAEMVPREETHHGVVIPQTTARGYGVGVVVAVHDGTQLQSGDVIPPKVALSNLVAYSAMSGIAITMLDQQCRLIFESNILAVLQEDYEEMPDADLKNILEEDSEASVLSLVDNE